MSTLLIHYYFLDLSVLPVVDMITFDFFTIFSKESISFVSAIIISKSANAGLIEINSFLRVCKASILLPAMPHLNEFPYLFAIYFAAICPVNPVAPKTIKSSSFLLFIVILIVESLFEDDDKSLFRDDLSSSSVLRRPWKRCRHTGGTDKSAPTAIAMLTKWGIGSEGSGGILESLRIQIVLKSSYL